MPENSNSLDRQLANNVRKFLENTGLTQRQLCKLAGIGDPAKLNGWLGGYKNLSSDKLGNMHRIINLSRFELEKKFTRNLAGRIVSLQERGRELGGELRFDGSGWVAKEGGTGHPVNSTGIADTWKEGGEPSGDDILDVLREIDGIYAEARKEIADRINKITQAKVNKGPTESPRYTPDNSISSKPGPRGDKFSITSRQHLEYLQRQRATAEEELAIQKAILAERKKELAARMELAKVEKQTVFST